MSGNQNKNQQKQKQQQQQKPRGMQAEIQAIDEAPYVAEVEVGELAENPIVGEQVPVEEAIVGPVEKLAQEYVALMGPSTAPTAQEQEQAIRILETICDHVFGSKGVAHAKEHLVPVLEFARENKATFRPERLGRGIITAYGKNPAAQRRMQAYVTVLARLVATGNDTKLSGSTLKALLGETKAEELRLVLEQVLRLKLV